MNLAAHIADLTWQGIEQQLDRVGHVVIPSLIDKAQSESLADLYNDQKRFRKRIVMEHRNYGRGEYQYFAYPLPEAVTTLRETLYTPLATLANRWSGLLNLEARYPDTLQEFLDRCHAAGQTRPTPLMLKYGQGDFNCMHQDLYGELAFPIQVAILLSEPGQDFEGGEFILTEQRARMQSRATVVPLRQGDAVVFAVSHRPEQGKRGYRRVTMRHGVSTVTRGSRYTMGVIFHDAA